MTSITIRDVPDAARDELAARAARSGRSLQEYLRLHLLEVVRRPDPDDLLARLVGRKAHTASTLSREAIVAYRDADRR